MAVFEQSQSIVCRIQQILREYPCGDTILFELLQNADDAKAERTQVVVEDGTASGTGGALFFMNSSVFSQSDLDNIKQIGGSSQFSKGRDGTKVGRFGVGFNSSYHISDTIAFVTGKLLIVFDPLHTNLPGSKTSGGLCWDYTNVGDVDDAERAFINQQLGYFATGPFGFDATKPFEGTVFRLQIRREPSDLWRQTYTSDDIVALVRGLKESGGLGMVMLKHVRSLEAGVLSESGFQQLFSFRTSGDDAYQASKATIMRWLMDYTEVFRALSDKLLVDRYVDVTPFARQLPVALNLNVAVHVTLKDSEHDDSLQRITFRMCHQFGPQGGQQWEHAAVWTQMADSARLGLPVPVPWSAAIADISHVTTTNGGRFLCFFPIPGHTRFPFHIHGYFQLSSDRQSISAAQRSPWNAALAHDVTPAAVASLMGHLSCRGVDTYALWPPEALLERCPPPCDAADAPTRKTVEDLQRLQKTEIEETVAYRSVDRLLAHQVRCLLMDNNQVAAINGDCQQFPNPQMSDKVLGYMTSIAGGELVVPVGSRDDLQNTYSAIRHRSKDAARVVTASAIRRWMRQATTDGSHYPSVDIAVELFRWAADDHKFDELEGVPVLPLLCPKTVGVYRLRSNVANPQFCLPQSALAGRLVSAFQGTRRLIIRYLEEDVVVEGNREDTSTAETRAIVAALLAEMVHHMANRQSNIAFLTPQFLAHEMSNVLGKNPATIVAKEVQRSKDDNDEATMRVVHTLLSGEDRFPLDDFFEYLASLSSADAEAFKTLPVLPPACSAKEPETRVVPLVGNDPAAFAVHIKQDGVLSCLQEADMRSVLMNLGGKPINVGVVPPQVLRSWDVLVVSSETDAGRLLAFVDRLRHKSPSTFRSDRKVSDYLVRVFSMCFKQLTSAELKTLASLPIFPDIHGEYGAIDEKCTLYIPRCVETNIVTILKSTNYNGVGSSSETRPSPRLLHVEETGDLDELVSLLAKPLSRLQAYVLAAPMLPIPDPSTLPFINKLLQLIGEEVAIPEQKRSESAQDALDQAFDHLRGMKFLQCAWDTSRLVPPYATVAPSAIPEDLHVLWYALWRNGLQNEITFTLGTDAKATDIPIEMPKTAPVRIGGTQSKLQMRNVQQRRGSHHADPSVAASEPTDIKLPAKSAFGAKEHQEVKAEAPVLSNFRCFAAVPQPPVSTGETEEADEVDAKAVDRALGFLGMKTELNPDDVVLLVAAFAEHALALQISDSQVSSFAGALVAHVDSIAKTLDDEHLEMLRDVAFVPVDEALYCPTSAVDQAPPLAKPRSCVTPTVYRSRPLHVYPVDERCCEHANLVNLNRLWGWSARPSSDDLVEYIRWCGAHQDADECIVKAMLKTSSSAMYDALEHNLNQEAAHGCTTTRELLGALDDVIVIEQEAVVLKACLACGGDRTQNMTIPPYLYTLDNTLLPKRFPLCTAALDVPAVHPMETILASLNEVAPTSMRGKELPERTRADLIALLEYLTTTCSTDELRPHCRDVLVPTSDGRCNVASSVAYDFFNNTNANPSNDVLHSSVSSTIARGLAMTYTSSRQLQQLLPRSQTAFSSAFRLRGQRQSLVAAIGRILDDYSDKQSVFFEMIQNADDAKAKKITFTLDLRRFPKDKEGLLGERMGQLQGPALCVQNDGVFSESDLEALLEIGSGAKLRDQLTIGRFGVGFNSVYHVTDVPSFVSGSLAVFLDPCAVYLESSTPDAPGLVMDFLESPGLESHFPHQFAPYEMYGVDLQSRYDGTLFRLPLRQTKEKGSCVSEAVWSVHEMRQLMDGLRRNTKELLLFMNHLEEIELREVEADGKQSTLVQRVAISNTTAIANFRQQQQEFISCSVSPMEAVVPMDLTVEDAGYRGAAEKASYLLSTCMRHRSGVAVPEAADRKAASKVIPWVTVAYPAIDVRNMKVPERAVNPQLYCFLPMAARLGLPFYLHGFFATSSDRRGMWTESYSSTEASFEAQWNTFLFDAMAPVAVCSLLLHLTSLPEFMSLVARSTEHYYKLLPLASGGNADDGSAATSVAADDATGISRKFAIKLFSYLAEHKAAVFPSVKGKWLRVTNDDGMVACFVTPEQLAKAPSRDVLLSCLTPDAELCVVPGAVLSTLQAAGVEHTRLSPTVIRTALNRRAASVSRGEMDFDDVFPGLNAPAAKARILKDVVNYCVSDVQDPDSAMTQMAGIPAVLTLDGAVGIVQPRRHFFCVGAGDDVLTGLPTMRSNVVHPEFRTYVSGSRAWKAMNVHDLDIYTYCYALEFTNLVDRTQGEVVEWDGNDSSERGEWLKWFWRRLSRRQYNEWACCAADWAPRSNDGRTNSERQCVRELRGYPLIPVQRAGKSYLCPMANTSQVLTADSTMPAAMQSLGFFTVQVEYKVAADVCGLERLNAQTAAQRMENTLSCKAFDTLSDDEREELLKWLLQLQLNNDFARIPCNTQFARATVRKLPLFAAFDANGETIYAPMDLSLQYNTLFHPRQQKPTALPSRVCNIESPLRAGYFRDAINEVDLKEGDLTEFYHGFFNKMMQDPTCLTAQQEVEYLRVLALTEELRRISQEVEGVGADKFVRLMEEGGPVEINMPLKHYVMHHIVENHVEYRDTLTAVGKRKMVQVIDEYAVQQLDCHDRRAPSELIPPIRHDNAPIPWCLDILLRQADVRVIPEVLWADSSMRDVLEAFGLSPCGGPVFEHAVTVAAETIMRLFGAERNVAELTKYGLDPTDETLAHRLAVSVAIVALNTGVNFSEDQRAKLCDMEFMPPYVHPSLPGCFRPTARLCAPRAMLASTQQHLAWTTRPLLDPLLSRLVRTDDPEYEAVLTHLQNLTSLPAKYELSLLRDVLPKIYKFLAEHLPRDGEGGSLGDDVKNDFLFRDVLCVHFPDERDVPDRQPEFVCGQVVVKTPASIGVQPYLYSINDFPRAMAAEQMLLLRSYEHPRHPPVEIILNRLDMARRDYVGLPLYFKLLAQLKMAAVASGVQLSTYSDRIFVPTSMGYIPAAKSIYPDCPRIISRVDDSKIGIVVAGLSLDLATALGVPSTVEVISEVPCDVKEQDWTRHEEAQCLTAFLRGSDFRRALLRLMYTESGRYNGRDGPTADDGRSATAPASRGDLRLRDRVRAILEHVTVAFVTRLEVVIHDSRVDVAKRQNLAKHNATSPQLAYDADTYSVYLLQSGADTLDPVYLLAGTLNSLLGNPLHDLLPLSAMLQTVTAKASHTSLHVMPRLVANVLDSFGCLNQFHEGFVIGECVPSGFIAAYGVGYSVGTATCAWWMTHRLSRLSTAVVKELSTSAKGTVPLFVCAYPDHNGFYRWGVTTFNFVSHSATTLCPQRETRASSGRQSAPATVEVIVDMMHKRQSHPVLQLSFFAFPSALLTFM